MKLFLLLLFLVIKISPAFSDEHFSSPIMLGQKCQGDEAAAAEISGQWADYHCADQEWMFRLANERAESPFFGKLVVSNLKKSDYFSYYKIVPTIPVGPEIRWILRRYLVRISLNGEMDVIYN
ncbi:MAG: hypothetical protein H0V66_13300 [Bdellovibrionales bacterium]|nr:hypothetical protein [Bdellovibrionales bacterium]